MNASKPTLGLVGAGVMGTPMGRVLMKAGYSLVVHDIDEASAAALVKDGATAAAGARQAAEGADIIILMLPNSPTVEAVCLGDEGVLAGVRAGSLVIDMGSSDPRSTRRLGAAFAEKGVEMLDAPVSGGPGGAEAGTLAIMVGGTEAVLARARDIFDVLGAVVVHVGDLGCGHAMKCMQNFISSSFMVALTEGLTVGKRLGVSPDKALEVLQGSMSASRVGEHHVSKFILTRSFDVGFALRLMEKDVATFFDLSQGLKAPTFLAAVVRQYLAQALRQEPEDADCTALARVVERNVGAEVSPL